MDDRPFYENFSPVITPQRSVFNQPLGQEDKDVDRRWLNNYWAFKPTTMKQDLTPLQTRGSIGLYLKDKPYIF